jgi:hypothetical protein
MEEVIKQLALKYNIDWRVVKLICYHPLLFAKHVMEDPDDDRAIMIRYFGKFVLKYNKTKVDKKKNVDRHLYKKSIALEKKLLKKQNVNDITEVVSSS